MNGIFKLSWWISEFLSTQVQQEFKRNAFLKKPQNLHCFYLDNTELQKNTPIKNAD